MSAPAPPPHVGATLRPGGGSCTPTWSRTTCDLVPRRDQLPRALPGVRRGPSAVRGALRRVPEEAERPNSHLDERKGTRLRALDPRRKARDRFALALERTVDPDRIVACFLRDTGRTGRIVTRAPFEQTRHLKRARRVFRDARTPLLRPGVVWNPDVALARVLRDLVARLPGEPWAGDGV